MTQTVNTGHDPIVMQVATIEVFCIIEEIRVPDVPSPDIIYHLMSAAQTHTLTPNFLQYPACDYVLNESINYDIQTDAPFVVHTGDDYSFSIESTNLDLHGIYTIVVTNTVTYEALGSYNGMESAQS